MRSSAPGLPSIKGLPDKYALGSTSRNLRQKNVAVAGTQPTDAYQTIRPLGAGSCGFVQSARCLWLSIGLLTNVRYQLSQPTLRRISIDARVPQSCYLNLGHRERKIEVTQTKGCGIAFQKRVAQARPGHLGTTT